MEKFIKIGQIINTHGNRGGLKVWPLTDDPSRYLELEHVYVRFDGELREYHPREVRLHKNLVLLEMLEISDMNEAEKLKGFYLELPAGELRPLPEGHYYIFQLVGLKVYEEGKLLGELAEVIATGSNDVYVVKTPHGKEFCLPALKNVVIGIDTEGGIMEVRVPPGLLD